jgi:hypothetical protein
MCAARAVAAKRAGRRLQNMPEAGSAADATGGAVTETITSTNRIGR